MTSTAHDTFGLTAETKPANKRAETHASHRVTDIFGQQQRIHCDTKVFVAFLP